MFTNIANPPVYAGRQQIVGTSSLLSTRSALALHSLILFAVKAIRAQNNGPLRLGNELIRASSLPENRMKFTRESNTPLNGIWHE